jgi:predicted metal-dependent hydrolase
VYIDVKRKRDYAVRTVHYVQLVTRFMEKIERILERYKIYLGVKDVAVEIRRYRTRDAFTNLTSSLPTIYINEYLIDDEEVVEYLILRELMHVKLDMYPSMRYGVPSLSYAEKFDSILHFYTKGES